MSHTTAWKWVNEKPTSTYAYPKPSTRKRIKPAATAGVELVYFVQAGDGGPVKIGVAKDVTRRLKGLQCGNPFPLRVLSVRNCSPTRSDVVEQELHQRFEGDRLNGEWFKPTEALLELASSPSREGFQTYNWEEVVLTRGRGLCLRCSVDVYVADGVHDGTPTEEVPELCSACREVIERDPANSFRERI